MKIKIGMSYVTVFSTVVHFDRLPIARTYISSTDYNYLIDNLIYDDILFL